MTFAHSHFYTGLEFETYINFATTLICDSHSSTFAVKGTQKIQKLFRSLITIMCPKNINTNTYQYSVMKNNFDTQSSKVQ
jgi:hypothetical protein